MASTTLDGATTVADWEMNEAAGATTMVDSSANHLDGTIIPSDELQTGVQFDVDTLGYHWVRRPPNLPPAVPERIVQVPDNNLLDVPDPSVTYTLEIRYRTKENFGNIVQKGQSASRGGQIKVQQPMGRPSCLFKGSLGRVTARVKAPLNDNLFHTLTCVRTPTQVRVYVDGNTVPDQIKNGSTGAINNLIPYTIGGKINCDQIVTTCDYFSGDIDYVKVTTTP
jgi:hypothetical protein